MALAIPLTLRGYNVLRTLFGSHRRTYDLSENNIINLDAVRELRDRRFDLRTGRTPSQIPAEILYPFGTKPNYGHFDRLLTIPSYIRQTPRVPFGAASWISIADPEEDPQLPDSQLSVSVSGDVLRFKGYLRDTIRPRKVRELAHEFRARKRRGGTGSGGRRFEESAYRRSERKTSKAYINMLAFINQTYGRYSEYREVIDNWLQAEGDLVLFANLQAASEVVDNIYGTRAKLLKKHVYSQPWYNLPWGIDLITSPGFRY